MKWSIVFGIGAIVDSIIIILIAIYELYFVLYGFVAFAVVGSNYLFNKWNVDERTETAIINASKITISIYFVTSISIGLLLVIYNQVSANEPDVFYIVGVTMVVSAIIIFYLQSLLSAYYDYRMS